MKSPNPSPERLFFRYAFPALGSCADIEEGEKEKIGKIFYSGNAPTKERLEELFPRAFERIRNFSQEENYWELSIIREYWLSEHNRIIEEGESGYGDLPHESRESCKVHFATVLNRDGDGEFYTVVYDGKRKKAKNLDGKLKEGNYVSIHLGHIIEEIDKKTYKKYSG